MRSSHAPAVRIIACVLAIGLHSAAALAGPQELYERGVQEFGNGNFANAITNLKASLDAKPNVKAALYLGNVYLELGRLEEAKAAFLTVLRLDPNHPKKAALETLIASIDARAEVKLHIVSNPPGATVRIDAEPAGRGTTPLDLTVPVGHHKIQLERQGYETVWHEELLTTATSPDMSFTMHAACEVLLSAKGPSFARASIDGAPPVDLPAKVPVKEGQHEVVFTAAAFETAKVPLECNGGGAIALGPTLSPQKGKLVVPQAAGTVVTVDGKVVDLTSEEANQGLSLAPGRHEVSVTVGYEPPRTSIVDVAAGESVQLGVPADHTWSKVSPGRMPYVEIAGGGNVTLRDWDLGANSFRAQNGQVRLSPGSSAMAGVRIGFQLVSRVALETEVFWIALPNPLDTSSALSYDLNLLIQLLPAKWAPFVEGGGGVYQVVAGELGSDTSARGHLGLGIRGRLNRWFSVRADARDVVSKGFADLGVSNNLELLAAAELFPF